MELLPPDKETGEGGRRKPSFMRRTWRRAKFVAGSPVANVGFQEISEGQRFIGGLWRHLRRGVPTDSRKCWRRSIAASAVLRFFRFMATRPHLRSAF